MFNRDHTTGPFKFLESTKGIDTGFISREKKLYAKVAGLGNQAKVVDQLGDGNCGYYGVLYGGYLDGNPKADQILTNKEVNFDFCQKLANHAENPEVI